jgi:hypothetical protein
MAAAVHLKQATQILAVTVAMVVHGQAIALPMLAVAAAVIGGQVVLVEVVMVIQRQTLLVRGKMEQLILAAVVAEVIIQRMVAMAALA